MPLHEYYCEECDKITEDLTLKISDVKEEILCEHCKKSMAQKTVSESRFELKGTGWYETDYGKRRLTACEKLAQKKI